MIRETRGTAAIELAFVAPVFVALTMAALMLGLLLFSATSLEAAVQDAARCAGIAGAACSDPRVRYQGMTDPPRFTVARRACGQQVTARATFDLDLIVWRKAVPLTASACG